MSYVANGGKCIILHCGLSLQQRGELIPLMGGKFDRHPAKTDIDVTMCGTAPALTKGVAPFTTNEEPYQFIFDPFSSITVFAEYQLEGKTYPHSWQKKYCKGEVVFLMGGHTEENIREEGNARLLQNTVAYLLGAE